MIVSGQSQPLQDIQRVQVDVEGAEGAGRIKISLENHDPGLGWYAAASLIVPLHQLPLLQQALDTLSRQREGSGPESATIVPFPGLRVV